jgi:hypothetical protein
VAGHHQCRVVVAVCTLWTRLRNGDGSGTSTLALGYCVLAANVFYFGQLFVLALSGARRACQDQAATTSLTSPLLVRPPSTPEAQLDPGTQDREDECSTVNMKNPLLQAHAAL